MSELFKNAVGIIRVGVQDYRSTDDHRHVSAVRNYYAGILLLGKAVLARRFPNEEPDKLIAANLKPISGPNGRVEFVPASQTTIDFATIGRRFEDLGIPSDYRLLKELNRIRNDAEHKYSSLSREAIVEVIAKGFPAAAQLFRLVDEDPVALLGDEWQEMLRTRAVFDAEYERAPRHSHRFNGGPIRYRRPSWSAPSAGPTSSSRPIRKTTTRTTLRCLAAAAARNSTSATSSRRSSATSSPMKPIGVSRTPSRTARSSIAPNATARRSPIPRRHAPIAATRQRPRAPVPFAASALPSPSCSPIRT